MITDLGFVGLGQMGAPMAARLIAPDTRLHVFDPSPDAVARLVDLGAIAQPSARALGDVAPIVFACLPGRTISEAVAYGTDGVAEGGVVRIYVEMSTIGRDCLVGIARLLALRGIGMVDAPISGGPPAAIAGQLAMMVSGNPDLVAAVEPFLQRIGHTVYRLGAELGQAQVMKLVNNLVMATNLIAAAEGLVMGAKAGLDPAAMMQVLNAGTGRSAACSDILARTALLGTFDFGAHLSIVAKDVSLGLQQAAALAVPVPVIAASGQVWAAASDGGRGNEDFTAIVTTVEQAGGATIRQRSADSA